MKKLRVDCQSSKNKIARFCSPSRAKKNNNYILEPESERLSSFSRFQVDTLDWILCTSIYWKVWIFLWTTNGVRTSSAPKEANSELWHFIRQRTCIWWPQDGHDQLSVCIRTDTLFLTDCKWRQPAAGPRAYDVWLAITTMNCFPSADNYIQKRLGMVAHVSC